MDLINPEDLECKVKLDSILRALGGLVFVIDEDGRYLDVLTSDEQLRSKTLKKVKDKMLPEIFPENIANNLLSNIKNSIEFHKTKIIEYCITNENEKRFFESRISKLSQKVKGKSCIILITRDITDQKYFENKLLDSEARQKAIGNALPDLLFIVDEEGKYLEILTSDTNLLYVEAEKLKGRKIHDVFDKASADIFLGAILRTIILGKSESVEYELKVPAGNKWFEARTGSFALESDSKKCVVLIARDITDKKRAEELESQNSYLMKELNTQRSFGEMVGSSFSMLKVFNSIQMVASTDSTVLLLGETGVGKEVIAQAIHNSSKRKDNILITVNCAAISQGLVESELFGHEKGSFTGATTQKKGKFELADRGTIFLDEVGELPIEMQVKLLRVLQEQEFERVGGSKKIKVNVRIIAATNRNLEEEINNGSFRSDLFYRLNVFPICIPPLRERKDDITDLANYFVSRFSQKTGKNISGLSNLALDKLHNYEWPGNVREMANIIERAVILCQGRIIQDCHIADLDKSVIKNDDIITLEEAERRHILNTLKRCNGKLSGSKGAATLLGVNRSTLNSRIKKLGIEISKKVN